jgi:hypothetical protein
MTPLIAVYNRRLDPAKRSLHCFQNEADFQALVQLPVHDVAGIPVHDGVEIHPALSHADIGDIHTPDLIRGCDGPTQQVGIDAVLEVTFAQVWSRIDGHDAHFPHVSSNSIWVNGIAFPVHNRGNLPIAQEGVLRIQFVDPVLEANFLRGGRDRLVIQTGAIETE